MAEELAAERELIARSQAGDLSAFNRLVEAYQDRVYNLCLRMLGSPPAAEDATQEAFLAAFRRIRSLRGENFRGWLLRIAANACLDELRRRKRRPQLSLDDPPPGREALRDPPDRAEALEARILRRELHDDIQSALMALPPDQRQAVLLCDVEEMSYEEIAMAMGSSVGTVKSRISRGRAKLRELLRGRLEPSADPLRPRE